MRHTYTYDGSPQFMHLSASASRYTGKERDAESGLDYFGARYYGSSVGRFMSPDWSAKAEPVPYIKLDDPQSLNLYEYVGNNPLKAVDIDGHYSEADYLGNLDKNREEQADAKKAKPQGDTPPAPKGNRTPSRGEPNTTDRVPGTKPGSYGERTYGPDGRAVVDIDHGHDHNDSGDPHAHDWDWSQTPARQPGRALTPEEAGRADLQRFTSWVADHKGAIAGTAAGVGIVVGGAAIVFTGGAATPFVLGVVAVF